MTQTFRLSLGMFTVLPVAPRGDFQPTPRQVRGMVLFAPVIGLLIGLGAALTLFLLQELFSLVGGTTDGGPKSWLAALLTMGLVVLITGGIHLDGLADTVDALASRSDRTAALEVMRRSDLGPMGAIALLFILAIQIASLTVTDDAGHAALALICALVTGRVTAVWACRLPAARPDGQGSWVAQSVTSHQAAGVIAMTLFLPVVVLFLTGQLDWPAAGIALLAVVSALVLTGLLQRWWSRRFGGITGDTLGAGVEISTAVVLIVMVLVP